MKLLVNVDGGARGNPGPAAVAAIATSTEGEVLGERNAYIGEATNNVAEYRALIAGLEAAVRLGARSVRVVMDSELVVRQMTGEYRVKNEGLKPLHREARQRAAALAEVAYRSVGREDNARADQLVNEALDKVLGSESPR